MKNLRRLACRFDLDQSERKSSQVNASAREPWPNGVASRHKLKTWVYLRLRLARAAKLLYIIYSKIAKIALSVCVAVGKFVCDVNGGKSVHSFFVYV